MAEFWNLTAIRRSDRPWLILVVAAAESGRAAFASAAMVKQQPPPLPGCMFPASVPPEAAERRARPVASQSRAQGRRGSIAGSMQHGAPLGHEVEEFVGGELDAETRAVAHHT